MKKIHLFGNWKMNMSCQETDSFFTILAERLTQSPDLCMAVFPPSVYLERSRRSIVELGISAKVSLGVQNVYHEDKGAFTGEISPSMALELGASYAILGHSERRALFGENSEFVGKKVSFCSQKGLRPVLCVGETLEDRDRGLAWSVVEEQLSKGLADLSDPSGLLVAYEPVWAIGTGRSSSKDDAQKMCCDIKNWLAKKYDVRDIPVLYGGSVKPENAGEFFSMEDVDGALVGGASLNPNSFIDMIP